MEIYLLIAAGIIAALELTVIIMLAVRGGDRGTRDDLRRLEKYVGDEFSRNRKETADSLRDMNALIREMQTLNARQSERISAQLTTESTSGASCPISATRPRAAAPCSAAFSF